MFGIFNNKTEEKRLVIKERVLAKFDSEIRKLNSMINDIDYGVYSELLSLFKQYKNEILNSRAYNPCGKYDQDYPFEMLSNLSPDILLATLRLGIHDWDNKSLLKNLATPIKILMEEALFYHNSQ